MRSFSQRFLTTAVTVLLCGVFVAAQDFRATITGRVTDPQKAAISGAQVHVKNLATNEVTSMVTDSEGNYKVPFLRPGSYSVTVEAQGFKKASGENIDLVINQVATVDITLEPGSIAEQVTVTAQAPLIESANADRGVVIDRQRVVQLPLNAPNPFMLRVLTAAV